jgi:hypothetical protein
MKKKELTVMRKAGAGLPVTEEREKRKGDDL